MQEIMEVKDDIGTVAAKIQETEAIWENIFTSIDNIKMELNDSRWIGSANEKCLQIHEAIKMYAEKIRPFFPEIHTCIEQLQKNKDNFVNASNNVALINSI